jgi:hypothetical protein
MVTKALSERPLFTAFFILSVSSTVFGLWFKAKQLVIASPELVDFYPWSGFALTAFQVMALFSTLTMGLAVIGSWIDCDLSLVKKNILYGALPFFAFLLSVFDVTLFYQFILFSIGVGYFLYLKINGNKWFFIRTKEPLLILVLFFIFFSLLYKTVSPFYDRSFFSLSGRLDILINLEHQWENAKAYDFLGNFSQNYRFGGYSQGYGVISPILSLAVLVMDIPLIDIYSKYDLIKFGLFFLYFFSSYGCYLFLRFGLKLSFAPSVLGGAVYILANSPFLSFLGNEYSLYVVPFAFLPWVMLFVSKAYSECRLELIFFAGLIAGLPQYFLASHPESVALFIGFLFIYLFWMALGKLFSAGLHLKSMKRFFLEVITFPIAVFIGMAYFLVPLFEAIILMEYAVLDTSTTMGLFWNGAVEHYSSIFFRFEDMNLYSFAPGLYTATAGPIVGFYTGQFSLFMIFFLLLRGLFFIFNKFLKRGFSEGYKIKLSEIFFLIGVIFCAVIFPMGHEGWFSELMEFTGFLRVHNYLRANMYFFFIALIAAMIGMNYLLNLKCIKTLLVIAGLYVLVLMGVYFSPLFPNTIPDKIFLDIVLFGAVIFLFSFFIWSSNGHKKEVFLIDYPSLPLINLEKFVKGVIIFLGIVSYYSLYPSARDYLTSGPTDYLDQEKNFYSFRSALVTLRGNRHDKSSYNYLDKRINDLENYMVATVDSRVNLVKEYYLAIYPDKEKAKKAISLYEESVVRMEELLRQRYVPVTDFKKYLKNERERKKITKEIYEQVVKYLDQGDRKLAYFQVAAPMIDNFYLNDKSLNIVSMSGVHPVRLAPVLHLTNSSYQYYLRDDYLFFIHSSDVLIGKILPIGKNHEISGPSFWGVGLSYPSKNITFHLRGLYNHAYDFEIGRLVPSVIPKAKEYYDFYIQPMDLKFIRPNPFIRKLIDVYGVDYISTPRQYLDDYLSKTEKIERLENLRSQGFKEFEFPESYRSYKKFPEKNKIRVFTNPQSYGRAYIAKWVKVIRLEDNQANEITLLNNILWPRSKILKNNFKNHMSSLPKNIWRSIIVESSTQEDYEKPPQVFEGDNSLDIKKIIASKSVFDVACQDEYCWFVYNTTFLNGWNAYSGSKKLAIHKANLGFIGLKLKKGQHFVWLEYAPLSLIVGFLLVLSGWFFVFFKFKTNSKLINSYN